MPAKKGLRWNLSEFAAHPALKKGALDYLFAVDAAFAKRKAQRKLEHQRDNNFKPTESTFHAGNVKTKKVIEEAAQRQIWQAGKKRSHQTHKR